MKNKIITGFLVIILVILLFFVGMNTKNVGEPTEAYQVYLNGKKIGLIKSKTKLLNMIDKEQAEIKKKYGVDKVYPPNGLSINKVYTYNNDIVKESDIYEEVKDIEPFTIKGYTVTINYNDESSTTIRDKGNKQLKLYTLDKDIVKEALYNTAVAFIGENSLTAYENGTQSEIVDEGEVITSVYYAETITIKDDYISTENIIFDNKDELSMYLLFGTNEKQNTAYVKENEDLQTIADNNNLNILELLVANPTIKEDDLLIAGQEINVGLIDPVVSVKYSKQVVEVVDIAYTTVKVEDKNQYAGYQETTTKGQNGKTKVTQNIVYVNGEINSLIITNKEVIIPTINEVITYGTKGYYSGGQYYGNIGTDTYYWPTTSPFIITSSYKWRWGKHHNGIDVSGTGFGSPLFSSTSGTVVEVVRSCPSRGYYGSSCGGGYGNVVKIRDDRGYLIIYGHTTNQINVNVGDRVYQGQNIAYMGDSGSSTGTHLHWEVRDPSGNALDPCVEAFQC